MITTSCAILVYLFRRGNELHREYDSSISGESLSFLTPLLLPEDIVCAAKYHRIINGDDINQFKYPYLVRLINIGCSGVAVDSFHVVTAAHCVHGENGEILGILKNPFSADSVPRWSETVYIHPEYGKEKGCALNDIAIMKLSEAIPFHVQLVLTEEPVIPGTMCDVLGWGTIVSPPREPVNPSDLQGIRVPLFSQERCNRIFDGLIPINPGTMCAGYETGEKDACEGDSGGPLLCGGRLAGIVSCGFDCAAASYPGIYTNISHFSTWIKDTVEDSFASMLVM